MKRVLAIVTLAIAMQFIAFVATTWYFGQSTGQAPVSTAFGQEGGQVESPPAVPAQAAAAQPGGGSLFTQGFCFTCQAFVIDQCEADGNRKVTIGGKISSDSMLGQDVFVSRSGVVTKIATVRSDGTFLGATGDNFAKIGQLVSVSIRPQGAPMTWIYPCAIVAGPPAPDPRP